MREIKFRAWNKLAKKMLYFDNPHFNVEYRLFCFEWNHEDHGDLPGAYGMLNDESKYGTYPTDTEQLKDWEVMQFTGLKDSTGLKDIYEGDIVESKYCIFRIKFEDGAFICDGHDTKFALRDKLKVTVVGNIYENPDLKPNLAGPKK